MDKAVCLETVRGTWPSSLCHKMNQSLDRDRVTHNASGQTTVIAMMDDEFGHLTVGSWSCAYKVQTHDCVLVILYCVATHLCPHVHAHVYACIHKHTHTHTCMCRPVCTQTHTHTHTCTYTHIHMHVHTHTHTHTHTYTHTHTHTHTNISQPC